MVESFKVDHTRLYAPYIRLAETYVWGKGRVEKYDIRFVTPNTTYIDDATMHSMEHLLATAFKKIFKSEMIDLSPMGCKTGFYFTRFTNDDPALINPILRIKHAIGEAVDVAIPDPTIYNCGSYYLHDIEHAREFIRKISYQLWREEE